MESLDKIVIEFDLTNHDCRLLPFDEFSLSPDNSKIYWIHLNLNEKNELARLAEKLNLPEHCLDLCHGEDYITKLVDDGESLTIQTYCLTNNEFKKNDEVEFSNLVMCLTARYCFTTSSETLPAIVDFFKNHQNANKYAKTPCFILFLIFDNIIDDYSKILFDLELQSDQIELEIRTKQEDIYNEIINIKKQILKIKRYAIATRDILMRSSGRKIAAVSEPCRQSLYNLYNHAETIVGEVDSIRDILNSTLDQSDNALMQKMNRTMQILTSFAAIFLPLSLIAGIYGMNFQWMPELNWKYGYFAALALMILCGFLLLFIFKKKGMV